MPTAVKQSIKAAQSNALPTHYSIRDLSSDTIEQVVNLAKNIITISLNLKIENKDVQSIVKWIDARAKFFQILIPTNMSSTAPDWWADLVSNRTGGVNTKSRTDVIERFAYGHYPGFHEPLELRWRFSKHEAALFGTLNIQRISDTVISISVKLKLPDDIKIPATFDLLKKHIAGIFDDTPDLYTNGKLQPTKDQTQIDYTYFKNFKIKKPKFAALKDKAIHAGISLEEQITREYPLSWKEEINQWKQKLPSSTHTGEPISWRELALKLQLPEKTLSDIFSDADPQKYPTKLILDRLSLAMGYDKDIFKYKINQERFPQLGSTESLIDNHILYIQSEQTADLLHNLASPQKPNDIRLQILKSHLKKHGTLVGIKNYGGYTGGTLIDFLNLVKAPDSETVNSLIKAYKIDKDDFYKFIIDFHYPEKLRRSFNKFSEELKKDGITIHDFFIVPQWDAERINYYLKNDNTEKLGFKIWYLRKLSGMTLVEAARKWGIHDDVLHKIETDDAQDCINLKNISDLSNALGIPNKKIKEWAKETYGEDTFNKKASNDRAFTAQTGSLKEMILDIIGGFKTYEDVVTHANEALKQTGLALPPLSSEVLSLIMRQTEYQEDGTATYHPLVSDIYLASFLIAFAEKLNSAKFWALARPDLGTLFPTLYQPNPHITVPTGTTLNSLNGYSIPEQIAHERITYTGNLSDPIKKIISERIGLSAEFYLSLYEGMDFGPTTNDLDRFIDICNKVGVDPRALYLKYHPWILTAVPVRDDSGEEINILSGNRLSKYHTKMEPSKSRSLAKRILTKPHKIHNGRQYVFTKLDELALKVKPDSKQNTAQQKRESVLATLDLSPSTKRAILNSNALPNDDTLDDLINSKALAIDAKALLEGFRRGVLLFFMGKTKTGEINWSRPYGWNAAKIRQLNLLELAQSIYSKLGTGFSSFGAFWKATSGFPFNGIPSFHQSVETGWKDNSIWRFALMAQASGHTEITPKIVYLKFNQDKLLKYVPIEDETHPQETTEMIPPEVTSFLPAIPNLAATTMSLPAI